MGAGQTQEPDLLPGQQFGGDGAIVPVFMQAAIRGEPIRVEGDGTQTRDFLYVEDLVQSVWLAWRWLSADGGSLREVAAAAATACDCVRGVTSATLTPPTFNIGTSVETSVVELARVVGRVTGRSLSREKHPPRPVISSEATLTRRSPTVVSVGWLEPTWSLA